MSAFLVTNHAIECHEMENGERNEEIKITKRRAEPDFGFCVVVVTSSVAITS